MKKAGRDTRLRAYLLLALAAGGALVAVSAGGCNDAALIQPPVCTTGSCTCESDPTQAKCRAFDGPGDSVDASDAERSDASADAALDGSIDAEDDATNDAADAAD